MFFYFLLKLLTKKVKNFKKKMKKFDFNFLNKFLKNGEISTSLEFKITHVYQYVLPIVLYVLQINGFISGAFSKTY